MMRPVLTREEYLNLRNSGEQQAIMKELKSGNYSRKHRLLQMNYSCLPNEDGTLKGSTRMSTTVGMDIDHIAPEEMQSVMQGILSKKDELGLLMLEKSARGQGYHLVFRRKTELSQEENLRWASELLGVKYDDGAKDITRVFFTTTNEELLFLDDAIFEMEEARGNGGTEVRGYENTSSAETFLAPPASIEADPRTPEPPKEELRFKGIPYSSIIAEYWRRTGGEPAEGERNVKLHKLAVNLRAICDNKKEVLMQVMPRYGLTDSELQSIVESACKEPTKGSKIMEAIVTSPNLPEGEEMEEECEQAFQHPLLRRGLGRPSLLPGQGL